MAMRHAHEHSQLLPLLFLLLIFLSLSSAFEFGAGVGGTVGLYNRRDIVVEDLEKYLEAHGVHSRLKVAPWVPGTHFDHAAAKGIGEKGRDVAEYRLVAIDEAVEGDVMLAMPHSTWIISEAAVLKGRKWKGQGPTLAPQIDIPDSNALAWDAPLALFVLHEKSKGKASPFFAHIQSLPSTLPSSLSFTPEEIEEVHYTPTMDAIKSYINHYAPYQYEKLNKSGLLPPGLDSLKDYFWALAIAWSRTLRFHWNLADVKEAMEDEEEDSQSTDGRTVIVTVMVPFADMINHSPTPNLRWGLQGAEIRLAAATNISAGSEVSINYGQYTNDQLLIIYGFVVNHNPRDRALIFSNLEELISWYKASYNRSTDPTSPEGEMEGEFFERDAIRVVETAMTEVTSAAEKGRDDVDKQRVKEEDYFSAHNGGHLHPCLLASLSALIFAHAQADVGENGSTALRETVYAAIASGSLSFGRAQMADCKLGNDNIRTYIFSAAEALRRRIEELLASYPTTEEEDELIIASAKDRLSEACTSDAADMEGRVQTNACACGELLSPKMETIVRFRMSKKRILKQAAIRLREAVAECSNGGGTAERDEVVEDLESFLHEHGARTRLKIVPWISASSSDSTNAKDGEMRRTVMEYAMVATADAKKGDVMLSMPLSTWVVGEREFAEGRAWKGQGPTLTPQADGVVHRDQWDAAFALFLLDERSKGNASSWAPYIRSLPAQVPSALFYTPEEIAEIEHRPSIDYIKSYRDVYITQQYSRLHHASLLPPGFDRLEDYSWAVSIAWSRSFFVEVNLTHIKAALEDPANDTLANGESITVALLLPFADMINHSPTPELSWQIESGEMRMIAMQDILAGSAVTIDYGPHADEMMLLNYGFTPDKSSMDRVMLFSELEGLIAWYQTKYSRHNEAAALGMEPGVDFFVAHARQVADEALTGVTSLLKSTIIYEDEKLIKEIKTSTDAFSMQSNGRPDPRLLAVLSALSYSEAHILSGWPISLAVNKSIYATSASKSLTYALSRDTPCNNQADFIQQCIHFAKEVILSHIKELLLSYPTTAMEDEDILHGRSPAGDSASDSGKIKQELGAGASPRSEPLSSNMKTVVKFRLLKKRQLIKALHVLEEPCTN